MADEMFYGERDTHETGSGITTFIDAGTLTMAEGTILYQCFCPKVSYFGSGPVDFQFAVDCSDGTLSITMASYTYANLFTAERHVGVYAEQQLEVVTGGDKDFLLQVKGANYDVICDSPRVPAWFRIVANPFSDEFTGIAAISHKFGLTHT